MSLHTVGEWKVGSITTSKKDWMGIRPDKETFLVYGEQAGIAVVGFGNLEKTEDAANANLIAAAPDMLEALRLHQAWSDSERAGPNYGKQSRATHPDGELIWRRWWDNQLDLCDRATKATAAAIAKADGRE